MRTLCTIALLLLGPVAREGVAPANPEPVTIPIEVVSNLVFMKGYVNGAGPLDAILDTGSSVSILSPALASRLNLTSDGSTQAAGIGKGTDQTVKFVDSVQLRLGVSPSLLQLDGQKAAILAIDYISRKTGHPVDALFGSNLYNNFTITVDYDRQTATFDPQQPSSHSGPSVPLQILDGAPYVTAILTGADGSKISCLFLLDTGTTGELILNKDFLTAHPQLTAGRTFVETPSVNAVGGRIDLKLIHIPGLNLGGYTLTEPLAAVPDQPSGALVNHGIAGIIGAKLLRRFVITWDYRGQRMWLVPTPHLSDKL